MAVRSILAVCIAAVLCTGHSAVADDDWPMFRCDALRSAYTAAELPAALDLAWSYRAPHPPRPAWSRLERMTYDRVFHPVVGAGLVIFGSSSDDRLRALDAATGRERWSFTTGGPIRFAPALWRERVFTVSDDGFLYCLAVANGELLWKHRGGLDGELVLGNGRAVSRWPARGGPVVRDGVVYFAAGIWPTDGIFLHALDAESGAPRWLNEDSGSIYMPQPHGGANAASGVSAQGHLVATDELILVPTGRSVPAAFARADGAFRYFRMQQYGQRGGTATMASGKHFFNSGVFFDAKSGTAQGNTGGAAIAGLPDGVVTATRDGLSVYRWSSQESADGERTRALRKAFALPAVRGDRGLIVAGSCAVAGGDGRVAIADLERRRERWSAEVAGRAYGLAAAGGRLYVATDEGWLYCFAGAGARRAAPLADAIQKAPYRAGLHAQAAVEILARSGVDAGYCVDLGCGDGALAYELARRSRLFVIGVEDDPEQVAEARRKLAAAGLYGVRVQIVQAAPGASGLPKYIADLVVSAKGLRAEPDDAIRAEAQRLQRPHGGAVCLGAPGAFAVVHRGAPPGEGEWTHQYADPANTACSGDQVAGRLGMHWFGEIDQDMPQRHGRGPAPLYSRGRIFSLGMDALLAVDAYNGRVLWEFELPGILGAYHGDHLMGTAGTHSPYCVAPSGVYVRRGGRCLRIDQASGEQLAEFSAPPGPAGGEGTWGYLACEDGLLIGSLAVPDHVVTYRYLRGGDLAQQLTESQTLFALDAQSGALRWRYDAEHSIRHNAIAIGGGRIYLIDRPLALFDRKRGDKPGAHPHGVLVALDAHSGRVRWRNREAIFGTVLALGVEERSLLMAYQPTRFRLTSEIGGRMAVFDVASGKRRWDAPRRYESRPMIVGRTIYAQGGAWDLRTGAERPFEFSRSYGCGILAAGARMLVFRSATLGYFNLEGGWGTENFGGMRPGCWINALPAGGLVLVPEATAGCVCSYQNRSWVALQTEDLRAPIAEPPGGIFREPIAVKLSSAEPGVELRYTLDGSSPEPGSPRYARPIRITRRAKLKARAFRAGVRASQLASYDFDVDRTLLPLEDAAWQVWDVGGKVTSAPSAWSVSNGIVHQSANIFLAPAEGAPRHTLPHYGTLRIYRRGARFGDGQLSLELRSSDNDGIGVAFRFQDPEHHYLFHWDQERRIRVLARRQGAAYQVLAHDEVPYHPGTWHALRIVLAGDRLAIHVDGAQVLAARDGTYRRGTFALHSWGSQGASYRRLRFAAH